MSFNQFKVFYDDSKVGIEDADKETELVIDLQSITNDVKENYAILRREYSRKIRWLINAALMPVLEVEAKFGSNSSIVNEDYQ